MHIASTSTFTSLGLITCTGEPLCEGRDLPVRSREATRRRPRRVYVPCHHVTATRSLRRSTSHLLTLTLSCSSTTTIVLQPSQSRASSCLAANVATGGSGPSEHCFSISKTPQCTIYLCDDCDKDFVIALALTQHYMQSARHAYCRLCEDLFDDWEDLYDHYEEEHYHCDECNQVHQQLCSII